MHRVKYATLLLLLFAVLGVPAVVAFLLAPTPAPVVVMPNPNGYDTLREASAVFVEGDTAEEWDVAVLKAWLASNEASYALVEEACDQEILIPLHEMQTDDHVPVTRILGFLRLIEADARIAEVEDRLADAVGLYTKIFDLSNRIDEGGATLDALVSNAGKGMALDALIRLEGSLSEESRHDLATRLREIGNDRIDVEEVRNRELQAARRQYGLFHAGMMSFQSARDMTQVSSIDQNTAGKYETLVERLSSATIDPNADQAE
ncbi:MAG: hypothetical protein AAFU85_33490 [Planctomycetota bacterium]